MTSLGAVRWVRVAGHVGIVLLGTLAGGLMMSAASDMVEAHERRMLSAGASGGHGEVVLLLVEHPCDGSPSCVDLGRGLSLDIVLDGGAR